jgi:2-phospho-L-lactate/phosphoenolpyruvate guanylyltransferase
MLADVLAALRAAAGLERLLVVSRDPAALALAASLGAEPLAETGPTGYRSAAEQAALAAAAAGAAALLVLPADIPLITPGDVERLLRASRQTAIVLVASRRGEGTNAILSRPPNAVRFQFGRDSFAAHQRAAAKGGRTAAVLDLPNVALDLDEPEDLRALLYEDQTRPETATIRYLREIALARRVPT